MTSIRESIRRFFSPAIALPVGNYYYQSPPEEIPHYRLYLRIESDGSGLLIVNASTILHLNQSATEYAYHLVNRTPAAEVGKLISRRYRVSTARSEIDFRDLSDRIQTLIETPDLDPEIYLDFERTSPISASPSAPYRLDCALTYRLPEEANPTYAPANRIERELSTDEWYTILDNAWQVGIPHVIFTGGEPTLRDDLPKLLAHAENNGQVTGILTDGLYLADSSYLNTLLQTGLDHALILLQPDNPLSWAAIDTALKADLFITIHLTITLQNVLSARVTLDRLAHMGVEHLSLSTADDSLNNTLLELRDQAATLGLSLIWDIPVPYSAFNPVAIETQEDTAVGGNHRTSLYVEPDGDVRPSQGNELVLGNCLSDPWEKLWQ